MFKGLKSKLEDGAKKLQNNVQSTVTQYGESISQQFRDISANASEAGSEAGSSITHRFFSSSEMSQSQGVGNALMEEVTEADLIGFEAPKERRPSGDSVHSTESSFSAVFATVPGMTSLNMPREPIESDLESTATEGEDRHSSLVGGSASKEQISSVLFKLQGRAADYKGRYRELTKKYNEVVTENNKLQTLIVHTQDKALAKISSLRDEKRKLSEKLSSLHHQDAGESQASIRVMFEKLKAEMSRVKRENVALKEDNCALKKSIGDGGDEGALTDLIASRISSEWKERMEKVEEQWTERLNKAEADSALILATAKAEMHSTLESKDREVETLRAKNRALEVQDGLANERWQKKVDELKAMVQALEKEKEEQVDKLSEAKIKGVQAVRDDEEAKRKEMAAEFEERKRELAAQADFAIAEMRRDYEEQLARVKEEQANAKTAEEVSRNEQMAAEAADEKGRLECLLEEASRQLCDLQLSSASQIAELKEALENVAEKQRMEVSLLISEHEEILNSARTQSETQLAALEHRLEEARNEAEELRAAHWSLQQKHSEALEQTKEASREMQSKLNSLEEELSAARGSSTRSEEMAANAEKSLAEAGEELQRLRSENQVITHLLEQERLSTLSNETRWESDKRGQEEELMELREMLRESKEEARQMKESRLPLEMELAQAMELSAIHEHLRGEVEEARKAREEAECRLLQLEKRAVEAETALLHDREEWEKAKNKKEGAVAEEVADCLHSTPPSQVSSELEDLRQELAKCLELNSVLERERRDEESTRANLERELADITASLQELESRLAEQQGASAKEAEERIEKIRIEMATISRERDELEKERDELKERIVQQRDASQLISQYSDEAALAMALAEESTNRLKEKEFEMEASDKLLRVELKAMKEREEEMKASLQAASGEKREIERQLKDRDSLLGQCESQLQTLREEVSSLEGRLADEEAKASRLLKQLEHAREALSAAKASLDEGKESEEKLERKMHEMEQEVMKKSEEVDDKAVLRVRQLEEIAERMRLEFLAKEKLISVLRAEAEEMKYSKEESRSQLALLQEELKSALEREKELKRAASAHAEDISNQRKSEMEEHAKLREQGEVALATAESNLAAALEREKKLEELLTTLRDEMKKKNEDAAVEEKKRTKELEEMASSSVKKLEKISKDRDTEVASAKAEFLLQMDELNCRLREAEKTADERRVVAAEREQLLLQIEQQQRLDRSKDEETIRNMEKELAEWKAWKKSEEEEGENELKRLRLQNNLLSAEVEEARGKVRELERMNEEGFKRAGAKSNSEKQKLIRELQKEVKQLYTELNEKTTALDEEKTKREKESLERKILQPNSFPSQQPHHLINEEELSKLRSRLEESHREVDELKEMNERLERTLSDKIKDRKSGANSSYDVDSMRFAEPTEAEYLRHVLFRYMNERETLGKETVTLARVIGTVAKFSPLQMDCVLSKEESRVSSSWHLASNVLGHNTNRH